MFDDYLSLTYISIPTLGFFGLLCFSLWIKISRFVYVTIYKRPQLYTWARDVEGHQTTFFVYRERWVNGNETMVRQDWWREVCPIAGNWYRAIAPWYQYDVGLAVNKNSIWPYTAVAFNPTAAEAAGEYPEKSTIKSLARVAMTSNPGWIAPNAPSTLQALTTEKNT